MSGETEERPSGWTTDTLAVHLQRQLDEVVKSMDRRFASHQEQNKIQFDAAKEAVQLALTAQEKAATKLETTTAAKFADVNEFRGSLSDVASRQITRNEVDAISRRLEEAIKRNETRVGELELRLTSRLDLNAGRGKGLEAGWGYLVAGIGVIGALIGIVLSITV